MSEWTYVGSWRGGTVSSVAVSPNFVDDGIALATTGAGIYRTTDGGETWQRAITGFADPSAVAVAFAPNTPDGTIAAFASTETGRLYASVDGGESWSEVTTWAGLGLITAIALSPDYATDQTLFVGTPAGVYRSFDGGERWEEASFGLLDLDILCLACAPDFAQSGVLWAGTALGGFYRSRNRGLAWRESGVGLPDAAIQCVVVTSDIAEAPVLFVGTESDGVYRSDDQGALWERAGSTLAGTSVNALTITGSVDGLTLLAGTSAGLYYTTQRESWGENWHKAAHGDLPALALVGTPQGSVLAATFQESLALSTDGGHSWQPTGAELTAHIPPLLLPTAAGAIYGLDTDGTLAVSQDGGASWSTVLVNGELPMFSAFTVGERESAAVLYGATEQALLRHVTTSDVPWEVLSLPTAHVTHLALSPEHGTEHQLLLANLTGELFLSENSGMRWQLLPQPWQGHAVLHLCFSPHYAADRLVRVITARANAAGNYAVTLWQSTDLAQGWTAVATLETEIPSVLVAQPTDDQRGTIFLATGHRVVKLYRDPVQDELAVHQHFFEENLRVTALVPSPTFADDQTIFAATTGGLFQSTDGGTTWSHRCDTPLGLPIVALVPGKDTQLRAVTLGGDVWFL